MQDPSSAVSAIVQLLGTGNAIVVLGVAMVLALVGPPIVIVLLAKRWMTQSAKHKAEELRVRSEIEHDRDMMHKEFLHGIRKAAEDQADTMQRLCSISEVQVRLTDAVRVTTEKTSEAVAKWGTPDDRLFPKLNAIHDEIHRRGKP